MDLSRPRSDRPVLWIVTSSHDSNGCLVSALKRRCSTLFSPPIQRRSTFFFNPLSKITLSLFLTLKPSLNHSRPFVSASLLCRCCTVATQLRFLPYSLKVLITLSSLPLSLFAILTLSKSQSLSRLYLPRHRRSSDRSSLSHAHLCLSPLSPSQLTLCLVTVAVAVIWYFITSNLFFLC